MTHRQREILDFIRAYQAAHAGVSPSFREIKDGLGMASFSNVYELLNKLKAAGHIHTTPRRARDITIIDDVDISRVPLARLVAELERRQVGNSVHHERRLIPEEQRNHG